MLNSSSSLMVRINSFARDLAAYLEAKKGMTELERVQLEDLLKREFEWLLRQDTQEIEQEHDDLFGA